MAVTSSIKESFRQCYGCSLETLSASIESIEHFSKSGIPAHGNDVAGRGYIYFGEGVSAAQKDKENRAILKCW